MSNTAAVLDDNEGVIAMSETFEDIGEEAFIDEGAGGEDAFDFDEDDTDTTPLFKRKQEEAKAQAKGANGEQYKVLETIVDDEDSDDEDSEEVGEGKKVPLAKKEEETEEEKPTEPKDDKAPKGKRITVKVGEESFALDSNATIPHKVDGKIQHVPVQELLNNFAGKVAWDQKFNEVNLLNQDVQRKEQAVTVREEKLNGHMQEIMDIINDESKNPFDALYKIVDLQNGDRYAYWERAFKTQLEELSDVLALQGPERSNYFLKKKNEYLDEHVKKRNESEASTLKLNSYKEQSATLRKSFQVTEAQYVDSYAEIKSWGYKPEEISEQQIVEWAAIKPHASTVAPILDNYRDQMSEESFSELKFKLAGYLRTGQETIQSITDQLEEVFGVPSDVKELNKELQPLGRPKNHSKGKTAPTRFESFSDLDDEDHFN